MRLISPVMRYFNKVNIDRTTIPTTDLNLVDGSAFMYGTIDVGVENLTAARVVGTYLHVGIYVINAEYLLVTCHQIDR